MNLELWNKGLCCECEKELSSWENHFGICNKCADRINRERLKSINKIHKRHKSLNQ